jgi:hypothetical protein
VGEAGGKSSSPGPSRVHERSKDTVDEKSMRRKEKSDDDGRLDGSVDQEHEFTPYAEEHEPFLEEVHNTPEDFDGYLEEIKKAVPQFDLIN